MAHLGPPDHAARRLANVRVLVVDDHALYREAMTLLLRGVGYDVRTAANGELGLDLCRAWTPSLVLVDYEMPIMNGLEFLDAKDADARIAGIPVVMITGSDVNVSGRVVQKLTKAATATLVLATVKKVVVAYGLTRSTLVRNDEAPTALQRHRRE